MIWNIARKEIHENILSLRFVLLLVLALTLVPASLYSSYQGYLTRLADEQQIERRNQDFLHSLRPTQLFTNANFTFDAYWPPSVGSVYAAGLAGSHPRHLLIGKYSVEYGAPLEAPSALGLFGNIDFLFIVQFVFSLFAVLLSFDAITREKEQGTLRSILSNSVSRSALAAGKAVGGYITLALPLILAGLFGVVLLAVGGLDVFTQGFLGSSAWIMGSSLLYVAVFFALGLLVSSMASTTYAALVVSLAIWLLAVVIAPRAASLVSQLARPVKSAQVVRFEKAASTNTIEREKGAELQRLWGPNEKAAAAGDQWMSVRQPVADRYAERISTALKEIEDDSRRETDAQQALGLWLARLSPAGALADFVAEMAGTGMQAERAFMASAERHRQVLSREFYSKVFQDVFPTGMIKMGTTDYAGLKEMQLPGFQYPRLSTRDRLRAADIVILLGWVLVASCLTLVALARYDVR